MTVYRDRSERRCSGCSDSQLFKPLDSMPDGYEVDYRWKCDVCGDRWRVKGVTGGTCRGLQLSWWQR